MISQEEIQGMEYSKGGRVRWRLWLGLTLTPRAPSLVSLWLAEGRTLLLFPPACWEEGQRDVGAFPMLAIGEGLQS